MRKIMLSNGKAWAFVLEQHEQSDNATIYEYEMTYKGYTLILRRDNLNGWMSYTTLHEQKREDDNLVTHNKMWDAANEWQCDLGEKLERELLNYITVTR